MNTLQGASTIRDVGQPDVRPAGEVLAKAFRGYPFFEYCLGDADNYESMAPRMFASFVLPARQGTGVGRQLMRYTFEQSDRAGLPCYLETFSESSVRVHESQLYSIRDAIKIPETPLTLYAMVRPAQ